MDRHGPGDPIAVRLFADEHAEARAVLSAIEERVDEGVPRSQIAVFYRTNAQSRVLEDALVRADVPYQVIGGTKFYERTEIKDAIAYLTLLANPSDQVSFTRIANSPRRGIGQTSLSRVIGYAATLDGPIFHVAATAETVPGLGPAAVRAIGRFMDTMGELRALAADAVPVAELLEAVLSQTGYVEALEVERTIEAQGRIENLEELVGVARRVRRRAPRRAGLDEFLAQIVARQRRRHARRRRAACVTLMTLHNAKGLEYPIVFIIGLRGGGVPALARARRGIAGGGTAPVLRRHHPGDARADVHLCAPPGAVRSGGLRAAQPLSRRDPRRAHRPRVTTSSDRALALAPAPMTPAPAASGPRRRRPSGARRRRAAPQFRMGEDVAHAAFGEGVVTGLEPGGIVVVRFARDGSERKLLAGIAPVTLPVSARIIAARSSPPSCANTSPRRWRDYVAEHGTPPGLATVLVGEDPASAVYVGSKQRACEAIGMRSFGVAPGRRCVRGGGDRGASRSSTPTRTSTGSSCSCPCPTTSTATS